MTTFQPKSTSPDNVTDRGKVERIRTSGAGDSTETTEWVDVATQAELDAHEADTTSIHGISDTSALVTLTGSQTLTNKTLTTPTLTLKQSASPTPTAEGDLQWDTDDNQMKVGDGSGTKSFSDDSVNRARANHTGTQTASTISDFNSAASAASAAGAATVGGDLTGTVANAQIAAGAIVNADVSASAAIALSKLATDPLARANHTGTQTLATISDAGSIASQAANNVTITGGSVTGITDITVADGGTGASTAAAARVNLGVDKRTAVNNADYTILSSDRFVAQTGTLSAPRTFTLPAANALNAGQFIIVVDESGTVTSTNSITVARAGSDTINGGTSTTITSAYGWRFLMSDGTSKWSQDSSVLRMGLATAKGDLLVATAANTITRLPVGSNDQVLTADSAQASGVKWAAAGAGSDIPSARPKSATTTYPVIPGVAISTQSDIALSANVALYNPIIITEACTLTELWCVVSTLAASSHVTMSLYTATVDWQPDTLVTGAFGEVDSSTTGVKKVTGLSIALAKGNYVTRVHADGTPTLRVGRGNPYTGSLWGTSTGNQQLASLSVSLAYTATPEASGTDWDTVSTSATPMNYYVLMLLTT